MKPWVKAVALVLAFVILSITLTWVWNEWLRAVYGQFFKTIAPPIYDAIGLGHARAVGLRQRYINFVPFVALLLVTPGLALPRRIIGLGVGLITISISHVLLNLTSLIQPGPALPVLASLVSDSFPFLVWFIIAYPAIVELIPSSSRQSRQSRQEETPDST